MCYAKRSRASNAIKVRDRALAPKSRMLLILVDGTKTVSTLIKSLTDPDEGRQVLGELLDAGYVEVMQAPQAAAAPAAGANTGRHCGVRHGARPLVRKRPPDAIRRATRLLENLLGPGSEPFCLQLEKCKSIDQFTARVLDIRRVVAGMRSQARADEFVAAALKS